MSQREYRRIPFINHPEYGLLYLEPPYKNIDGHWRWGMLKNEEHEYTVDCFNDINDILKYTVDELEEIDLDAVWLLYSYSIFNQYVYVCCTGESHRASRFGLKEILKGKKECKRINKEIMPRLFDTFYIIIEQTLEEQKKKERK